MYLEEKAPGEVQAPVKITKLSQAIRAGIEQGVKAEYFWQGCAVGTAAKALGWDGQDNMKVFEILRSKLGVSQALLEQTSYQHSWIWRYGNEITSRQEVAAKLEQAGL